MSGRPSVSVSRCADYDPGRVAAAVEECLGRIDADDVIAPGVTVLLKPNLLSSSKGPDEPVNTHPAVVRAVAAWAAARGARVQIGDSCGRVGSGATAKAFEVAGLVAVAAETGAELVNFDMTSCKTVAVDTALGRLPVSISRAVVDADAVIDLPKLKTHGLTFFTGAVKNLYGVVAGKGKKTLHMRSPNPRDLSRSIVDLLAVVRPRLTLMDGIIGMEGPGPNSGPARRIGVLIGGRDPVAVDAAACAIVGFAPFASPVIRLADERGLGVGRLDAIDWFGAPLAEVRVEGFRPPYGHGRRAAFALVPDALARAVLRATSSAHCRIDAEKCVVCGQCIANCPPRALRMRNGRVECTASRCIACYCCEEVCDYDAAHVAATGAALMVERAAGLCRRMVRLLRRKEGRGGREE